jgi:hypothetical protein
MLMVKRVLLSLAVAVVATVLLVAVAALFGGTAFARFVVFAGEPLGRVLFFVLPNGLVSTFAPEGGAVATAFVFALSALVTWLATFWVVASIALKCFLWSRSSA